MPGCPPREADIIAFWKDWPAITTYRNVHLIYNPTAGRLQRGGSAIVPSASRILQTEGAAVAECPTSAPGDATRLAREAVSSGADLVVVAGGDGTLNEVLNGLVHSTVPLAVVPCGTANVLA
ncbi:MAG: acylglycerol kinase family protein, partial [bacterium]|nr:acylglycerol kinase family protein [bacterium]